MCAFFRTLTRANSFVYSFFVCLFEMRLFHRRSSWLSTTAYNRRVLFISRGVCVCASKYFIYYFVQNSFIRDIWSSCARCTSIRPTKIIPMLLSNRTDRKHSFFFIHISIVVCCCELCHYTLYNVCGAAARFSIQKSIKFGIYFGDQMYLWCLLFAC